MWRFGIEHEVALLDRHGQFVDWTNTTFADLARIIDQLPTYEADYPQLHRGDSGIRVKRWYIEGLERFDEAGELAAMLPKGIEIRTPPRSTIAQAVADVQTHFEQLRVAAAAYGYTPALTSFNPCRSAFVYDPPLNAYEQALLREEPELQTDNLAMLTYGPDLNLSRADWSVAQAIDAAQKLTAYSPFIVAWSLSAPFYAGAAWDGLSLRTFVRTGARPAARVWVADATQLIDTTPPLTKLARVGGEAGRVEFKACDTLGDLALYAALLALLKGLLCDSDLAERALVPDERVHKTVARHGFDDPQIAHGAGTVLHAAEAALAGDPDQALLAPLRALLATRTTPAHALLRSYQASGDVLAALRAGYTPHVV
jgi:hypothetical protein